MAGGGNKRELDEVRQSLADIYPTSAKWRSKVWSMNNAEVRLVQARQSLAVYEALKYTKEAALAPAPPEHDPEQNPNQLKLEL